VNKSSTRSVPDEGCGAVDEFDLVDAVVVLAVFGRNPEDFLEGVDVAVPE